MRGVEDVVLLRVNVFGLCLGKLTPKQKDEPFFLLIKDATESKTERGE